MGTAIMLCSDLLLVFLLLDQTAVLGFMPTSLGAGDSISHRAITERALLNTTLQVCRDLAAADGKDFSLPSGPLNAEIVTTACLSPHSLKSFVKAIRDIKYYVAKVDFRHFFNPNYHFTDDKFEESRKIITDGLYIAKASIQGNNLDSARKSLGTILHPLQDFYSHSNWVEIGNKLPNSKIIRQDTSIGKIAENGRATCRSCVGDDCNNNILEDILREQILTFSYFSSSPLNRKPNGKCSHGGSGDFSSRMEPTGGINKDTLGSSHGKLHFQAVGVALAATVELLEDLRRAVGDREFLRLMGTSKMTGNALCFVVDTTSSMSDDLIVLKRFVNQLIDGRRGTKDKPSLYILVPVKDTDTPVTRTTDPEVFRGAVNALKTHYGLGRKQPTLAAVQLALTSAPPGSDIFVFTDQRPSDSKLIGTIKALIESTKTTVNFMLTGSLSVSRRRRRSLKGSKFEAFGELAESSGGQAIQVDKTELAGATSIITDASSPLQVTLLQVVKTSRKMTDRFSFSVDQSLSNLTVYITGHSLSVSVTSPSGASQSNQELNGTLGTIQTVGNFLTLRLIKEVGTWEISMTTTQPYTVKVIGQSSLDFLFDFVEMFGGPHPGFVALENRPSAGSSGTMLVTVTGSDSVTVTEVALVDISGSGEVKGNIEPQGGRDFLVRLDRIPQGNFVVRLRGEATSSTSSRAAAGFFQRQTSTSIRASSIRLTADSDDFLEPGTPFSVPFTVATNGTGGTYTIRASNDRGFDSSSPSSLLLVSGGVANGTVTLTAPAGTASGSDVTLTIEAEAPGAKDTNYAVLRLSVFIPVTDIIRPVCQVLRVSANCSADCSLTTWQLSANLTDGNGTGIESLTLRQGNGTLNTSTVVGAEGYNVTLVSYSASCCSPVVELVAVDRVGNVGSCLGNTAEGLVSCVYISVVVMAALLLVGT